MSSRFEGPSRLRQICTVPYLIIENNVCFRRVVYDEHGNQSEWQKKENLTCLTVHLDFFEHL